MGELLSEAFFSVAELASALGATPLTRHPNYWRHKVDEHWTVAINATKAPAACEPEGCMFVDLPPYHLAVWWHGWLAGLLTPYSGQIAAHPSGANEGRFIADVRAATVRAGARS